MNSLLKLGTNFGKILICCLLLFLMTACAGHHMYSEGDDVKDSVNIKRDTVTLKSSNMHEECFELVGRQKLFYEFNSDQPVDFNVHFHNGDKVHYPVQQNGVTKYDGMIDSEDNRFKGSTEKHYCLMWENPETGQVNLSYECIVKEK